MAIDGVKVALSIRQFKKEACMYLKFILWLAIFAGFSIAHADSVSLPIKTIKKPSNDLVRNGNLIDAGQAAALAQQGEDLSLLNPVENKLWQNRNYSATDEVSNPYPKGANGVKFLADGSEKPFYYSGQVQSLENPKLFYRLSIARHTHTAMMRAALLRKLGYYVNSPKYYRNLKVTFASEEQKEEFIKTSGTAVAADFEDRKWIIENNKKEHSIVLTDAVLESASSEYFNIVWGDAPKTNTDEGLSAVRRLSAYRAWRALIVPYALIDVPESINRFSLKFGSVLSGHVVITDPFAEAFSACTYEDARWLTRRLANLNTQDFKEIVKAGQYPKEFEELIYAKLIHRANNALELFDLKNKSSWPLPDVNRINSGNGVVKNGKVIVADIPGYPHHFSAGDKESPFQDGDLERYLWIRAKSAAIGTAINAINEKLDLLKISDLYENRRQEMADRIAKHIKEKPLEPLYQRLEGWGGPVGGLNLSASRHVTTGTYFGSSAPIQLVDNMSVAARLGYFMTLEGVPNMSTGGGANVMVTRDYTHVRPLLSITEGSKVEWKTLIVPRFMNKLATVLGDDKLVTSEDGKAKRHPLDVFLSDLREGEVFTITDSIALSAYAQVSASLDVLMGITPLNFMASVTAGADGSRVILKQTNFMRTKEGIQVYVRSQNNSTLGMTLDVNFFINVMRARANTTWIDLSTDAFVIDYNPGLADMVNEENKENKFVKAFLETRKNLRPALHTLFTYNNPELLYTHFTHNKFEIDHGLKTKEFRQKFLAIKLSSFNEDHLLKIRYPRNPEAPELDPKDEEVTLFANKKGELEGRDLLGFAFDWLEGILNKWWPQGRVDLDRSDDPNPANTPFGKAHWRMVTTESDLTANGTQYPSVATVQRVWGGWHLKREKFFKLLDEVQAELKGAPLTSYRIIQPEVFTNVKAVDFYRISANLSILPGGLDRIRDLILQPQANGKAVKRGKFLESLKQKFSEAIGEDARANDMAMFNAVVNLIGGDDYLAGRKIYMKKCKEYNSELTTGDRRKQVYPTEAWVNGTHYECMIPWMRSLLRHSADYPVTKKEQTQWMTNVIYILEKQIPLPYLLKFLGEENYLYLVRVNGFGTGYEDGDIKYFSNTLGDPKKNFEYANGLISMYANKTRISPIELDRSQGSFR